jgi:hypothetical protein
MWSLIVCESLHGAYLHVPDQITFAARGCASATVDSQGPLVDGVLIVRRSVTPERTSTICCPVTAPRLTRPRSSVPSTGPPRIWCGSAAESPSPPQPLPPSSRRDRATRIEPSLRTAADAYGSPAEHALRRVAHYQGAVNWRAMTIDRGGFAAARSEHSVMARFGMTFLPHWGFE